MSVFLFLALAVFLAIAPFVNWNRVWRRLHMKLTNSHAFREED